VSEHACLKNRHAACAFASGQLDLHQCNDGVQAESAIIHKESVTMIGITLSLEQVRTAPPEVRRWIEKELASSLGFLAQVERHLQHAHSELAACSQEEALGLFELIRGDYLACQVFFELGRGADAAGGAHPLHALSIGDIMRHTRIHSGEHLLRYLTVINEALQQIRHDPDVRLFGFDEAGHCYVHEETPITSPQCELPHYHAQPRPTVQVGDDAPPPLGQGVPDFKPG
jgi:hypothetical protein